MRLDRLEGNPDTRVAWGSDIAAQMLRRMQRLKGRQQTLK